MFHKPNIYPFNGEYRRSLLDKYRSTLQLRSDIRLCLLVPDSHYRRLTETLPHRVLSPSTLFSMSIFMIVRLFAIVKSLLFLGLCQVFVGTFFVFSNSVEKLCVSWALSLVECVAVWALKLPVPHTDVLKPTSRKVFLRNY